MPNRLYRYNCLYDRELQKQPWPHIGSGVYGIVTVLISALCLLTTSACSGYQPPERRLATVEILYMLTVGTDAGQSEFPSESERRQDWQRFRAGHSAEHRTDEIVPAVIKGEKVFSIVEIEYVGICCNATCADEECSCEAHVQPVVRW